jgi:hypothetical protein
VSNKTTFSMTNWSVVVSALCQSGRRDLANRLGCEQLDVKYWVKVSGSGYSGREIDSNTGG